MIISKGAGKIQPLNVYRFRIWKNFAKKGFQISILLLESNINLHERNNILGVQLCFRRFFPKFEALL